MCERGLCGVCLLRVKVWWKQEAGRLCGGAFL